MFYRLTDIALSDHVRKNSINIDIFFTIIIMSQDMYHVEGEDESELTQDDIDMDELDNEFEDELEI